MPINITFDSVGTGTRADLDDTDGERLFVGQEATILSTNGGHAVTGDGDNQVALIRGELYGSFVTTLSFGGDNSSIFIADTGSVGHGGDAAGSSAVFMSGENVFLQNAGTISGNTVARLFGEGSTILNTGTISSFASTQLGVGGYAISTLQFGSADPNAISTIENHGTVSSNFRAIAADEDTDGNGSPNFGAMISHVTNTGDIYGDVYLGGFDDELHNSGYINGDVYMGDDDDLYSGVEGAMESGTNIYLGSGDDIMEGGDGRERVFDGSGDDEVELGGGNDYVRAGGGADNYDGGAGKDYISYYGSSNGIRINLRDNEISGSWGNNDTINDFESASGSRTGDDRMLGTDGANTLQSYGGDDSLFGRGGNDKLRGGDGEDYFDGGAGADLLWGGDDADVFHFDHGEDKDIIKDFENNVDTIELDNFGLSKSQAFDHATDSGGNVTFDFGDGDILIVENASIAQLQNDLDIV